MNQVFLSKTFKFQLNRLYKYTCWTSDRNTPFPLGYRNMHGRILLEGGLGPSVIVVAPLSTPV